MNCVKFFLVVLVLVCFADGEGPGGAAQVSSWTTHLAAPNSRWTLTDWIPTTTGVEEPRKGKLKIRKKFKRLLLPLLLAYKLKFFTLIPVMIGGLILLTGATGLAGFFFALFAAVMGLKSGGGH